MTNRGALERGRLFSVLAILLFCSLSAFAEQSVERPNIIIVMADDHAQWALGAYGLRQLETPNIDWLAERGVLFEQAMSPAPVCSPARASFYTGKMPSQHGVHDFLSEQPAFDAGWLRGETLLSQRLKQQGYRTGLFGKWHASTNSRPPQAGFDRWLSYDPYAAGWQNQYLHSGEVRFSDDGKPLMHSGVQSRFLTEEAIRFIDDDASQPFFISLNFVEPHAPFSGLPERLVSRYRSVASKIVPAGGASALADRGQATRLPEDHVEQLAQYLAAIALIDEQVGRLLDGLQGRGLLDNTLLVYTSDHGMLMGQYGLYGKTNATNPPNFYEETLRIPMIAYAPGLGLRDGQRRQELVDLLDLHATVVDYASGGRETRSDYGPGRSLRPLLEGARQTKWRRVQFAERADHRMVTDRRWKLVRRYFRDAAQPPMDTWYDLAHPAGERHAADAPDNAVRERLTAALETFFERYEASGKSGRRVWEQPAPNARLQRDLQKD